MQHQRVRRVLIAGGDIGGLVAAIALQSEGIAVSVFERVKERVEGGAGLTLWTNALRAIQKTGLTDLLESVKRPEHAFFIIETRKYIAFPLLLVSGRRCACLDFSLKDRMECNSTMC